jgi:hypothetical protein
VNGFDEPARKIVNIETPGKGDGEQVSDIPRDRCRSVKLCPMRDSFEMFGEWHLKELAVCKGMGRTETKTGFDISAPIVGIVDRSPRAVPSSCM